MDSEKEELKRLRRKISFQKYYFNNKEKIRARYLANEKVNREKSKIAAHKYYVKNRAKVCEAHKQKRRELALNKAVKTVNKDVIDDKKRVAILEKKEKLLKANEKKEQLLKRYVTNYNDGTSSFEDICHTKECTNKIIIYGTFITKEENKIFCPRKGQSWLCKSHTEKLNKIETWLRDNNEEASAIVKRVIDGLKPTHKEFNFGKLVETWIKDEKKRARKENRLKRLTKKEK